MARKRIKQPTVNLLLRLPPHLHEVLVESAETSSPPNSLNREIVVRLTNSLAAPRALTHAGLARAMLRKGADNLTIEVPNQEVAESLLRAVKAAAQKPKRRRIRAEVANENQAAPTVKKRGRP